MTKLPGASRLKQAALIGLMMGAVCLAYANHFQNGFHFDDSHAIVDNAYIRSLKNTPLFFTDARTFSVLPANRTYRPLVSLSLAVDYWLGHGLVPVYFQVSTFLWFLLQLLLVFALFYKVCEFSHPGHSGNLWTAVFATSLYGLHPALADTVNYVIQRGEIYSTLGVVAGISVYAWFPRTRRYGLYLLPAALGQLSKPPALVFPAILFVYILLFESTGRKVVETLSKCIPAFLLTGTSALLSWFMTPKTYIAGAASAYAYRITQPLVALRYFRTFFVPDQLSADTDHVAVAGLFEDYAWLGFLFVIALVLVAVKCSRRREWRPAAFGLWWFLIALVPTAVFPLAEIENDHRLFFPFIGLALAVCWPVALWGHRNAPLAGARLLYLSAAGVAILIAFAEGTWQRNGVWHSDEALWSDVTLKSPRNGRGLMNYGLTQLAKGEPKRAVDYFERALVYNPAYPALEVNLGIANGALDRDEASVQHFTRAIQLAPEQAFTHFFYGRSLQQKGRTSEAMEQLRQSVALNPDYLEAWYLLMQISAQNGAGEEVKAEVSSILNRFPSDPEALAYLNHPQSTTGHASQAQTADDYLNLSLSHYRSGQFVESIAAARQALKLRPQYAEAYNNMAAAYASMGQWDQAIAAARQALMFKPDFPLARNNLAWAEQQKRNAVVQIRAPADETASVKVGR